MPIVALGVMARWFPFVSDIRRLNMPFHSIWRSFMEEKRGSDTPPHLIKFKGLKELIVALEGWDLAYEGYSSKFQKQYRCYEDRMILAQSVMEGNFRRYETEYPDWKRPSLKIVGNEDELYLRRKYENERAKSAHSENFNMDGIREALPRFLSRRA
jgi:hypothetical protein